MICFVLLVVGVLFSQNFLLLAEDNKSFDVPDDLIIFRDFRLVNNLTEVNKFFDENSEIVITNGEDICLIKLFENFGDTKIIGDTYILDNKQFFLHMTERVKDSDLFVSFFLLSN